MFWPTLAPPRKSEGVMTTERRGPFSFERPFYWSFQKLEILEKYATAAARILGKYHRVTFVDLMAGEAQYSSGDLGSTGHFAAIAAGNAALGRQVRCIAYEANDRAFAMLEANTAQVRALVEVRHARWETEVSGLLSDLRGDFALFFVDPMGLRDIPWSALEAIVRRDASELLVNFASPTAARLVGKWRSGTPTAAGDKARLDAVYGGDSWIVAAGQSTTSGGELHERLARHYAERLASVGSYSVARQTIRQAGARGRPKYHIMFASRAPLAFEIMNGVLAGQTERLRLEALAATSRIPEGQLSLNLDTESVEEAARRLLVERLAASFVHDESLRGRPMTVERLFRSAFSSR
ncbi:MAG: three-Cys-motif partner protein TcmP, partial [Actinophytocola sp.]|nr:three-Cys-motif partner protein TcmP [Actinophytocola sp.]